MSKPTIAELEALLASEDDAPITTHADGSITPASGFKRTLEWPGPTPEMLESPQFNAVWDCIKTWDINVPGAYSGYMGATGNHARAIIDALCRETK